MKKQLKISQIVKKLKKLFINNTDNFILILNNYLKFTKGFLKKLIINLFCEIICNILKCNLLATIRTNFKQFRGYLLRRYSLIFLLSHQCSLLNLLKSLYTHRCIHLLEPSISLSLSLYLLCIFPIFKGSKFFTKALFILFRYFNFIIAQLYEQT